jgi:asparagine synthase (glutamine-hydrolysing)
MCSIAGITNDRTNSVSSMLKTMIHRSPDEIGFYKNENISIGMGRLSILDLKSKNLCPFETKKLVLSFNGEIYNYKDLRNILKKIGYKFYTSSDTEVLAYAWEEWGTKSFDKIKGMFAFAIYDKTKNCLYLARDIPGEKPLYYSNKNNKLYFASEAKAIKEILNTKKIKDKFFETFQHCLNTTLWKDIYQVPAAHYVKYDIRSKKFSVTEYWKLKKRKIYKKDASQELEHLIEKSVKLCTQADVNYGIYSSKGIRFYTAINFSQF